jgi:hypothetical protein
MSALLVLTGREVATLTRCEKVIERGQQTFLDVGNALLMIREQALYRSDYDTFDDYCLRRWGFSSSRARQFIAAAKTAATVETSTPLKESHAKELSRIPADKRQAVLDWATEKNGGKPPTTAEIKSAWRDVAQAEPERDDNVLDVAVVGDEEDSMAKPRGSDVGLERGNEAIDALKRVYKNDLFYDRAFQLVFDWITAQRGVEWVERQLRSQQQRGRDDE